MEKRIETPDLLGFFLRLLDQAGVQICLLYTSADHGNAEMMIDPATGGPHTAHTTNPVPFIVVAEDAKQYTLKPNGSLRDISPTMLAMLGVDEPKEMTGNDLRAFKTR